MQENSYYEIDIVAIIKKIIAQKKIIYYSILVFFFLGLLIAFGTPKEYEAKVTLLVESGVSSGASSLLQQFSGLAGINVKAASDDNLKPDQYPEIIKTTPFLLEVLNKKVNESRFDSVLTVMDYLNRYQKNSLISIIISDIKEYTIGLPGKIFRNKNKTNVESDSKNKVSLLLTPEEASVIGSLKGKIKFFPGESNGIYYLSVTMQDPLVATQLTDSVVKSLTKYIIEYRTRKAKNELNFITESQIESEKNFSKAQQALAKYKDRNKNLILAEAQTEGENLQSEYNRTFNVYNTLSQQLEQAKIKVQEKTPVLTIIDPAQIPQQPKNAKKITIFIIMIFLGTISGTFIIVGKIAYSKIRRKIS